jgi:hypothetical protein
MLPLLPRSRPTSRSPWAALLRGFASFLLTLSTSGCESLPVNSGRAASTAFDAPEQTPLGRWVLERKTLARAGAGSAFHLLNSADNAFTSRLALNRRRPAQPRSAVLRHPRGQQHRSAVAAQRRVVEASQRSDRSHAGARRAPAGAGGGELVGRAPPGAAFADAQGEPDASTGLRWMVRLIAPFAPDEML